MPALPSACRVASSVTGLGRSYQQPTSLEGSQNALYRNRGDGTFEDVSEGAGVGERRRRGGALEEALAEPEAGREHPRIDAGRISFVLRRHSLP